MPGARRDSRCFLDCQTPRRHRHGVDVKQPLSTALTMRIWCCTLSGMMNWAQKRKTKRTQTQSTLGKDAKTNCSEYQRQHDRVMHFFSFLVYAVWRFPLPVLLVFCELQFGRRLEVGTAPRSELRFELLLVRGHERPRWSCGGLNASRGQSRETLILWASWFCSAWDSTLGCKDTK